MKAYLYFRYTVLLLQQVHHNVLLDGHFSFTFNMNIVPLFIVPLNNIKKKVPLNNIKWIYSLVVTMLLAEIKWWRLIGRWLIDQLDDHIVTHRCRVTHLFTQWLIATQNDSSLHKVRLIATQSDSSLHSDSWFIAPLHAVHIRIHTHDNALYSLYAIVCVLIKYSWGGEGLVLDI